MRAQAFRTSGRSGGLLVALQPDTSLLASRHAAPGRRAFGRWAQAGRPRSQPQSHETEEPQAAPPPAPPLPAPFPSTPLPSTPPTREKNAGWILRSLKVMSLTRAVSLSTPISSKQRSARSSETGAPAGALALCPTRRLSKLPRADGSACSGSTRCPTRGGGRAFAGTGVGCATPASRRGPCGRSELRPPPRRSIKSTQSPLGEAPPERSGVGFGVRQRDFSPDVPPVD